MMMMPSVFGRNVFDEMDKLFSEAWFGDGSRRKAERELWGRGLQMSTDVKETPDGYVLEMNLPGFAKDEVRAELENGYLTIRAVKEVNNEEKDEENGRYIRRERYSGSCERVFYVGENVKKEDIKASFKDGVLTLNLPKKEEQPKVPEKNFISIEG